MKKIVLLIEDEKNISDILRTALKKADVEIRVEIVKNGVFAIDKILQYKPDLVLLDLVLPGVLGIDILQKIRSEEEIKQTKVIILSNLNDKDTQIEALRLGALEYLVKVDNSLTDVISTILKYL